MAFAEPARKVCAVLGDEIWHHTRDRVLNLSAMEIQEIRGAEAEAIQKREGTSIVRNMIGRFVFGH